MQNNIEQLNLQSILNYKPQIKRHLSRLFLWGDIILSPQSFVYIYPGQRAFFFLLKQSWTIKWWIQVAKQYEKKLWDQNNVPRAKKFLTNKCSKIAMFSGRQWSCPKVYNSWSYRCHCKNMYFTQILLIQLQFKNVIFHMLTHCKIIYF